MESPPPPTVTLAAEADKKEMALALPWEPYAPELHPSFKSQPPEFVVF